MMEKLYNDFHQRVDNLTGDSWCPYGSTGFMKAVIVADSDSAREAINERRKYMFNVFMQGEPQQDFILKWCKEEETQISEDTL